MTECIVAELDRKMFLLKIQAMLDRYRTLHPQCNTFAAFARLAGVCPSTISRVMKGDARNMLVSTYYKFEQLLKLGHDFHYGDSSRKLFDNNQRIVDAVARKYRRSR